MVEEFKLENDIEKNDQNRTSKSKRHHVQHLQDGENDLELYGYRENKLKTTLTWFGYVITFGLLRLFYHWYPHLRLYSTHTRCSFALAEKILVVDKYKKKYKTYYVEPVEIISLPSNMKSIESQVDLTKMQYNLSNGTINESNEIRTFLCKRMRFVWDQDTKSFLKLVGLTNNMEKSELHNLAGYNNLTRITRYVIYGSNEIDVPLETIGRLLILEALTPFYMFQLFSIIVWFAEFYYYYTIAIILMSTYGIAASIIQTRQNQKNLRGTLHKIDEVMAWSEESAKYETIKSSNLVPGDIIVIPSNGCAMQCDAALLNGTCIVNESMLTGESVPVLKTALQNNETLYNEKEDFNHTLYCGTTVLQSRCYGEGFVKAVVLRTGYMTSKGELVRSIMYPPPADFKFDQDSYKYIGILAFIALLGFIYTVISKISRNLGAWDITIKALDILTIVIPPALPAAMTIGKLFALNRLKKKNIYCINSRVINVSGSINCVCFDKTGTLTEDGLDLLEIVPVENLKVQKELKDASKLPLDSLLLKAMTSCHSLTIIDGNITGDPLDFKMFESTDWLLKEPTRKHVCSIVTSKDENFDISVLHRFQFSSKLQRMSVIAQSSDTDDFLVLCKGSPEMILSLSNKDTIPVNITNTLYEYTNEGYRVIAVGVKRIPPVELEEVKKLFRGDMECDLEFVGLLIFENKLKPQTSGVIKILKDARMKVVMITGDNMQTAISVAKECEIVEPNSNLINISVNLNKLNEPQLTFEFLNNSITQTGDIPSPNHKVNFTLTGTTWSLIKEHFPQHISKIVTFGTIFARMSSEQKQQLIVELQNIGYYVAMCGDGTNDCGALKAAHVGISLSEAEASVASPFTSKEANISCVTEVVKEGRAALVTSFGVFKFMLCYSLTEFTSVIILYGIDCNLTSLQFLFIDICLALNFASLFGITNAYDKKLFSKSPGTSLLAFIPIMSLILHVILVVIFQAASYYIIQTYEWFTPFVYDENKTNYFASFENYAVFSLSMFQYITTAIVFSKGKPYRLPIYTNRYFVFSICLMVAICTYMTLYPAQWIVSVLDMMIPEYMDAKLVIVMLAVANLFAAFLAEDLIVDCLLQKKIKPKLFNIEKTRKKYLKISQDLRSGVWMKLGEGKDFNISAHEGRSIQQNGFYNEAFEIIDERL